MPAGRPDGCCMRAFAGSVAEVFVMQPCGPAVFVQPFFGFLDLAVANPDKARHVRHHSICAKVVKQILFEWGFPWDLAASCGWSRKVRIVAGSAGQAGKRRGIGRSQGCPMTGAKASYIGLVDNFRVVLQQCRHCTRRGSQRRSGDPPARPSRATKTDETR
jgi:hypothetical protein